MRQGEGLRMGCEQITKYHVETELEPEWGRSMERAACS